MPIKFNCSACSVSIKAPPSHVGQTLPCPKCGLPVQVPAATPSAPVASSAPPMAPSLNPPMVDLGLPSVTTQPPAAVPPAITGAPTGLPSGLPAAAPVEVAITPNAFAAPQTKSERYSPSDRQPVKIVDIQLPFKSVFKFCVQVFAVNLLLVFIVWMALFLFMLLLGALFGVGASLSL